MPILVLLQENAYNKIFFLQRFSSHLADFFFTSTSLNNASYPNFS